MAAVRRLVCCLLAASMLTLGGCVWGLIYTDVTEPLSINMDRTPNPAEARTGSLLLERLEEPLTGFGLRVEVHSNAIGDAAKQSGLNRIYYADIRTVSFLLGIYQRQTVIVTGE